MDIIKGILEVVEKSEKDFKNNKTKNYKFNSEIISTGGNENISNKLYIADNLKVMEDLLDKGYAGKLDLIYIDPPFFTKANYSHRSEVLNNDEKHAIKLFAYEDKWKGGFLEYLEMITIRLFYIRELLSERGTIYLHLDSNAVHYVKIIMDHIFGRDRFLNEIIWSYKSGGSGKRSFSKKHDNILVYTKTDKYIFNPQKEKSYNRGLKAYNFKGVKEYKDHIGWYTLVNLKDLWQIDMVGRTAAERVGYATQKPEKLLKRMILSSSEQTSIVGDFFVGSGTTAVVAEELGRRWIISDLGNISESVIRRRLMNREARGYEVLRKKETINSNIDIDLDYCKDENLINIKLKKYNIDIEDIKLGNKDKEMIGLILKNNSLNLIEYIGIGYKDGNGTSIIFKEVRRDPKTLIMQKEISIENLNKDFKNLYLNSIDIFGNKLYKNLY